MTMLGDGVTHLGVATDHVIESFRNDLWATYKDGLRGRPRAQAAVPMGRGGDGRARARPSGRWWRSRPTMPSGQRPRSGRRIPRVDQVVICTPDKDLAQCVGGKVIQFDRRARAVPLCRRRSREKYGVDPESIPGLARTRRRQRRRISRPTGLGCQERRQRASPVRPHRGHPARARRNGTCRASVEPPSSPGTLHQEFEQALLFKRIATLETDVDVGTVDEWRWTGPTGELQAWADRLDYPRPDPQRRAPGRRPGLRTGTGGGSVVVAESGLGEDLLELDGRRVVELGVPTLGRCLVGPPPHETGRVAEPSAREVLIGHLDGQLRPQGHPVEAALAGPSARRARACAARRPRGRPVRPTPPRGWSTAPFSSYGANSPARVRRLLAAKALHTPMWCRRGGDPSSPPSSYRPRSSEPTTAALVAPEARDDAVRRALVLHLEVRACPG